MESESEISEVDDSSSLESVLIDNDGLVEELTNTIEAKLLNDSPVPESCCIFRVPDKIRRKREQAYEPDIVSIGPINSGRHGDSGNKFRLMENVKHWYLQCLLSRVNITLAGLIKGVMDLDKRARDCYSEPFNLNKKDFVEMMVLDGCFLIELFRKGSSAARQRYANDPVYSVSCMREYLYHDLILLENQLPWFVLELLYNLTAVKNTTCEGNALSLTDLVLNFFRQNIADKGLLSRHVKPPSQIRHILDLIRAVIVAPFEGLTVIVAPFEGLGLQQQSKDTELPKRIPNATTLSNAGIKFQKSSTTCILKIKFENGVFTIPPLPIDETTEPLFRNLIAFEQCYHRCSHVITSYAILMDNVIDSSKDIDLLCERGILANWLSAEDAVQFFSELYNDTTVTGFYYEELCSKVNKYYNTNCHKWMEKLRREHFDTPWAIISLVAAFILLVLTVLQTVYTIHQYYSLPK